MSLTSYRAAPPRDQEPTLLPHGSTLGKLFQNGVPDQPGPPELLFFEDRFGHHDGRETLAANLDLDFRIGFGELRRNVAQTDADVQRRTLRAAGNDADARAVRPNRIMRTRRRGFVRHLERD